MGNPGQQSPPPSQHSLQRHTPKGSWHRDCAACQLLPSRGNFLMARAPWDQTYMIHRHFSKNRSSSFDLPLLAARLYLPSQRDGSVLERHLSGYNLTQAPSCQPPHWEHKPRRALSWRASTEFSFPAWTHRCPQRKSPVWWVIQYCPRSAYS